MNEITSIQPSNLAKLSYGKPEKTITSGDFEKVSNQGVSQEIANEKTDLSKLKDQEVDGQIDVAELDSQMASLNSQLQKLQNYLKFERDEDSNRMVIFIKDSETDEIIRQIPTEDFLNISKSITQYLDVNKQVSNKVSPPIGMFTNETV